MSGAVNFRLIRNKDRVIDADVSKEIVGIDFDSVHLTQLYNEALNFDREEAVVVASAIVEKHPYEVYRTLAQHASREDKG